MDHHPTFPVYNSRTTRSAKRRGEYTYVKRVLGLASDKPDAIAKLRSKGFSFEAVEKLQETLSMSDRAVAKLLEINHRTLTRRREKDKKLDPLESDRLLRIGRLVGMAIEVMDGDTNEAIAWLREPNDLLGDQRPMDVINNEVGARQVEEVLGSLEWSHTA